MNFRLLSSSLVATLALTSLGLGACCPEPLVDDQPPVEAPPPDGDNDGVIDADDRCPAVAGVLEYSGCPDSDGDTIPDDVDACVDVKGMTEHKGCPPPDADGDSIFDADDACPNDKGPKYAKGCPDGDLDGIPDKDDKCPAQAGVQAEAGCLPEAAQAFNGVIKGITFANGRADVLRRSHKTLDAAVEVLTAHPSLHVMIEGHTDNRGVPEENMTLSQQRAEAVKAYLVEKGIAAERIQAKGYGDTKPVGDNATGRGRAENRRTEFKILGSKKVRPDFN